MLTQGPGCSDLAKGQKSVTASLVIQQSTHLKDFPARGKYLGAFTSLVNKPSMQSKKTTTKENSSRVEFMAQ